MAIWRTGLTAALLAAGVRVALHYASYSPPDLPHVVQHDEPLEECVFGEEEDLLVLVNKDPATQLRSDWEPTDLVALDRDIMAPKREGMLREEAAEAITGLIWAAFEEEQYVIRVGSSYRSYHSQEKIHRSKLRKYGPRRARRVSAQPGHSQHQLGTTVDLSVSSLDWKFKPALGKTPEGRWLADNAHRFGFVMSYPEGMEELTGYAYEPWHFRYIGESACAEMHEKGIALEAYLADCQSCSPSLDCGRQGHDDDFGSSPTLVSSVGVAR